MFLCQPLFTHPSIHTPIYLLPTYPLPTFIYFLLITHLPNTYLPIHLHLWLLIACLCNKKNNVQKKLVIITNVNDDEKMFKININLIVNKHFRCEW